MFIALNSCPSFLERLYCKAFYDSKTSETITLLTSKIVKQSKPNVKSRAQRVFAKITQVFGFKHIKFQHEVNQSFGKNVKLMKNIIHIKGEQDVSFPSFPAIVLQCCGAAVLLLLCIVL